jgi:SH3-like domain-containing protein
MRERRSIGFCPRLLSAVVLALSVFAPAANAADAQQETRFVSIRGDTAYMREGPSAQHKVKWVYRRKGLPVEVLQTYDVWRRVRDSDGETGWMHVALLSGTRTALIQGAGMAMVRRGGEETAAVIAQAQPGAIGHIKSCIPLACELDFGDVAGWVDKTRLWGIHGGERF